ncbi:hypothetical protein SUGI_0300270 [Cryptomeria japonica]|nr:hypothetical protein SUGI_0300270 [Cryptomeria japonica]
MVWHRENAVNAYLDSVKLCKEMKSTCFKKMEPQSTEFISALAAGMNAQLIVEVCSAASQSTVGLAAAARQTGGRFICIVAETQTQTEIYKAVKELGLENTTEFVIGDAKEFLPKYPNVDFALIDCKIKEYPDLLKLLNVNPTRAAVITNNLFDGKLTAAWEKRLEKKVGVKSTTLPIGKGIQVTKIGDNILESCEAQFRDAGSGDRDTKSCACNAKGGRKDKRSKWIVQVDERTGEEHVFRVFTHRSKPTCIKSVSL